MRKTRQGDSTVWLVVGEAGHKPELISGVRETGGIRTRRYGMVAEHLYEPMGRDNYFLLWGLDVPSDGDLSHDGTYAGSVDRVSQSRMMVTWGAFCEAREQVALRSLFDPGSGPSKALHSFTMGMVALAACMAVWQTWGLRGEVTRVGDAAARMSGPPAVVAPGGVQGGVPARVGVPAAPPQEAQP